MGKQSRNNRTKGFTLVELLVVIAIIGILASFLMPALTRAQDMAYSAACKNNLKNMGIAMFMYEESYEALPVVGRQWMNARTGYPSMWYALAPYLGLEIAGLVETAAPKDIVSSDGLACPSFCRANSEMDLNQRLSYTYWNFIRRGKDYHEAYLGGNRLSVIGSGGGNSNNSWYKDNSPGRVGLIYDWYFDQQTGGMSPFEYAHGMMTYNVLAADMHVETSVLSSTARPVME